VTGGRERSGAVGDIESAAGRIGMGDAAGTQLLVALVGSEAFSEGCNDVSDKSEDRGNSNGWALRGLRSGKCGHDVLF
jgi:hypothetical protein